MFNSFKDRSRWVCLLILIGISLATTQLMAEENPVQSSNLEVIVGGSAEFATQSIDSLAWETSATC